MSFLQNTCKPEGLGGRIMVEIMNAGHAPVSKWGMGHISVPKNAAVLDVGCGGGANLRRLLAMCPEGQVKGIDYSPVSVQKSAALNERAVREGRCRVIAGSVMELPFDADSFDCVTAFETVYFWPDMRQAFLQIHRVLKSGGVFMICNEVNGHDPKNQRWTDIIEGMRLYDAGQLEELLRDTGFDAIQTDENRRGWLCITAQKPADAP